MDIKKNWSVWLAVVLPVAIIIFVAGSMYLPRHSNDSNVGISFEENSKIETPYSVSVKAPYKSNFQKGMNSYEFKVTNLGLNADTYHLSADASVYNIDKNLTLPVRINIKNIPETVFLKPGKSMDIKTEIEIPAEIVGAFRIIIRAESQSVLNLDDTGETDVFVN